MLEYKDIALYTEASARTGDALQYHGTAPPYQAQCLLNPLWTIAPFKYEVYTLASCQCMYQRLGIVLPGIECMGSTQLTSQFQSFVARTDQCDDGRAE